MNNTRNMKFILLIMALLVVLLILCNVLLQLLQEGKNHAKVESYVGDKSTIKGVIVSNESEFIKQEDEKIYISSAKDLYNEDGTDNELYFEKIIDELIPFFSDKDFTIIDETKDLTIYVKYDFKDKDHKIYYNDIDDFYEKTNGENYAAVDDVKIVKGQLLFFKDHLLQLLEMNSGFFSMMSEELKDGVVSKNNYTNYFDGKLSVRLAPNNAVKNIVFRDGYSDEEITNKITLNSTLDEIKETLPENAFGSVESGVLGYRTDDYYIFYYDDEISIYAYAYKENSNFEKLLSEYIENKDLKNFVEKLTSKMKNYDYFKYDENSQSAYLLYASRGIEINIKENDTKGITLYTNYFFTNDTKKLVKNGYISFNSKADLIEVTEEKRRNNTLKFD